ncbi:MAG: hypothetical protein H7336_09875, partial [Bacteriovorax sp.]|nr:hypothetical protein [Bacteriovorax sp.]
MSNLHQPINLVSSKHYSITIKTKPYLCNYLHSLYGNPIVFTQDNYFGMTVQGFLIRKFFKRHNNEITYRRFDKFDTDLNIFFPKWWKEQSHFGTHIPTMNIIYINKLFEKRFEEDLAKHCMLLDMCGVYTKKAIEDFCNMHNIEIDKDIKMNATMTQTETKTYTGAQDVREVFVSFNEDICAVLHDVAQATQEFDLQQVQQDCAILALYDAISEIRLQIYVGDEIIREYSYKITDSGENSGAPAGQPPLGYTHVAGGRVRLVAIANSRRPK